MTPKQSRPSPPPGSASWAIAVALLASIAGCSPEATRALDAQAAANGTAGAPNNGAGGRGGGN